MSQLSLRSKSTNPDYIYYDIVTSNFQSVSTSAPFLRFSETRSNAIVPNSGDYYLSIIRFSLDTYNLPSLVAEIQPDQGDPDLSIYSITMDYVDATDNIVATGSQTYLNWVPQDRSVAVPPAPSSTSNKFQDNAKGYYDCYNIQYFITLVNETFKDAFASLTADPSFPVLSPAAVQPIMTWDDSAEKAILNSQAEYYNQLDSTGTKQARIRIFMNPAMWALFNTFPSINFGVPSTLSQGKEYQIAVGDFLGVNTILLPTNAPSASQIEYTQTFQDYNCTDTWTPISSIVFTSNTLPIYANQLSAPQIYNDNSLVISDGGNNANFAQIITDLQTNQQGFKPQILYEPTAEYRRIEMTGNTPIQDIDIEVYWRDKLGLLRPFYLGSGGSATIKFLFERKEEAKVKDLSL